MPQRWTQKLRYVAGQKEIPFSQQQQAASKFSGWFPSFNTETSDKHGKQYSPNPKPSHKTSHIICYNEA
jgi:hypothetical protein